MSRSLPRETLLSKSAGGKVKSISHLQRRRWQLLPQGQMAAVAGSLASLIFAGFAVYMVWPKNSTMATEREVRQPFPAAGHEQAHSLAAEDELPSTAERTEVRLINHRAQQPIPLALSAKKITEAPSAPEILPPPAKQVIDDTDQATRTSPLHIKRRRNFSEEDLQRQLAWAPEVSLRVAQREELVRHYEERYQISHGMTLGPEQLLDIRPDFARLPIIKGERCRIGPRAAATLTLLSRKLRTYMERAAPKDIMDKRPDSVLLREVLRVERRGQRPEWLRPEAIPVLLQLLMHEDKAIRMMLVELLHEIPGERASVALAQRAVFDLSPEVREEAIVALSRRPRAEYREVLLRALRYPWSPAADHAAEAIVATQDREAVPRLIDLLEKPDPDKPDPKDKNRFVVRELVRINHQANCLMCHPPAVTTSDPVPGIVPGVILQTGGSRSGSRYGSGGTTTRIATASPLYVRADVTFMRQDFAVLQPVPVLEGTGLTANLRFDYLVRTRILSAKSVERFQRGKSLAKSEQRDALLFALRELTGTDRGSYFEDWKALLPKPSAPDAEVEAARLADQLVKAAADREDALLAQLRDSPGVSFTEALARVIPRLKVDTKAKARAALAKRLTRMTAATLRDKLQDDNLEIRRAAVLACASKPEKALIPELISRLQDREPEIAGMADRALKTLTGEDVRPASKAAPAQWADIAAAWKAWWEKQSSAQANERDEDSQ